LSILLSHPCQVSAILPQYPVSCHGSDNALAPAAVRRPARRQVGLSPQQASTNPRNHPQAAARRATTLHHLLTLLNRPLLLHALLLHLLGPHLLGPLLLRPLLVHLLRPLLARRGARNKELYLRKKGLL